MERRHGSGTFVLEIPDSNRDSEREKHAEQLVSDMLAEAARLGLKAEEIFQVLEREMGISKDA